MITAQAEIHAYALHNANCNIAAIREKWSKFDETIMEKLRPLAEDLKKASELIAGVEFELDRTIAPYLKSQEAQAKEVRDGRRNNGKKPAPYSDNGTE